MAVDLNVKQLAVITVRQHGQVIQTRFVSDQGLDQARFRHLKRIARKQWQSGKPVTGEHSNQQLWAHIRRMNTDAAHKAARAIVPGVRCVSRECVGVRALAEDQVRKAAASPDDCNRKQANQLRGQINQRGQRESLCARQR